MRIEIGKKYIDASGDIVKIVRESEDINYEFVDDKCVYFTKDGYYYSSKTTSEYDLICEVDDSIMLIYNYEFILAHYIKYGGNLDWIKTH